MFNIQEFLEKEKFGPTQCYKLYYFQDGEWKVAPYTFRTLESAQERAAIVGYTGVPTQIIKKVEVKWSEIETREIYKTTEYTLLV